MLRLGAMLAILLGTLSAAANAQARLPTVLTGDPDHAFQVRPASIAYTGDGTGVLGGADGTGPDQPGHLHWARYDAQAGRATGRVWINTCQPSCAAGTFKPRPVAVTVGHPAGGHFHSLVITYSFEGHRVVDHRTLRRQGTAWVWAIAR